MNSDTELSGVGNSSSPDSTSNKLTIELGKLTYYQKPVLGLQATGSQNNDNSLPLQLIFPSGNFGLGIPLNVRSDDTMGQRRTDIAAIMSVPEQTDADILYRRGITVMFLVTFIVNLILTGLLYANINAVDLSKVEPFEGINYYFAKVADTRTNTENVSFGFTILILIIGAIGALVENPTILSAFCYSLLLNFVLGTQTIPSYAYSMRYILDIFLIYLGLILRQKCNTSFLPVHMHGS